MSIIIADLETNAIHRPSEIFMVGILDYVTDEFTAYTGDDVPDGLLRMAEAEVLIGHHIRGYDVMNVERLMEGLITFDQSRIVDTLELSRKLFPKLVNHKMATWGEIFDFPKLDHKDFTKLSPEMITYCERDCRLNKMMFDYLMSQLETT